MIRIIHPRCLVCGKELTIVNEEVIGNPHYDIVARCLCGYMEVMIPRGIPPEVQGRVSTQTQVEEDAMQKDAMTTRSQVTKKLWGLNEYQTLAGETAVYPGRGGEMGVIYTALGLAGEAGEFANEIKKVLRDGVPYLREDRMALELGDILWYLSQAANELGYSLKEIAALNYHKLKGRQERGQLHGSGGDR